MVENRLDITENVAGLLFIPGQTHDDESFTDGDEWLEVDEAGDETSNQSGDKRLSAATPDDEISFL